MKRNIFLSVFLPLFLCAAILTLGYFSPTLFSRVMPNFKNKESAAQITGAESPLYLEDPSSLILPPWNDIDDSKSQMYASDNQSVPYSIKMRITDDLQTYAESTGDSRFYTYNNQLQDPYVYIDMSDLYVRSIIEPFLKGCTINDNMQFSGYMHTYDPNDNFSTLPKYIYAQNVTVNTKEGRDFLVDFVFTPISGIPLYVHATEIDAATAAFPEDSEFSILSLLHSSSLRTQKQMQTNSQVRLKAIIRRINTPLFLPLSTIFPRIYSLFRLIRPRKKIGELNCLWVYETACMTCCTTLYTVLIPPPPSITTMNL